KVRLDAGARRLDVLEALQHGGAQAGMAGRGHADPGIRLQARERRAWTLLLQPHAGGAAGRRSTEAVCRRLRDAGTAGVFKDWRRRRIQTGSPRIVWADPRVDRGSVTPGAASHRHPTVGRRDGDAFDGTGTRRPYSDR